MEKWCIYFPNNVMPYLFRYVGGISLCWIALTHLKFCSAHQQSPHLLNIFMFDLCLHIGFSPCLDHLAFDCSHRSKPSRTCVDVASTLHLIIQFSKLPLLSFVLPSVIFNCCCLYHPLGGDDNLIIGSSAAIELSNQDASQDMLRHNLSSQRMS